MAHDVFISYSSIDRKAADAACAIFEAAGIRCWIAPRDVAAGAEWAEAIIDAIEAAKVMVLVFSSNSNESRQVRREVELAVSRGLTIMPLRLEGIEPTKSMAYYMAGVHWIDALTPPLEAHFKKMVGWIKPHLDGSTAPEPERTPDPARAKAPASTPAPGIAKPPTPAPPAQRPRGAKPQRKSSSIFADFLYEFFGVGAKQGGVKIGEAARAVDAARALGDAGKYNEAIAAYLALIERIEEANSPSLDLNLATARLNLGVTYRMAGRLGDAIDAYRALVRSCGDIADEMVEKLVAMGMNNQASALIDMDRGTEAIPIYDDLIQRFDGIYNTELNTQVAMARYGRGVALGALGRNAEAVTAYDEAITRIDLRVYPSLERYVAMSLGNKGGRLAAMGRSAEALSTYEEVISRFRESKDRTIRWDVVAKAMVNSAGVLIDLKRYDEGLARCETLIGSSSSREPAPVPQLVAIAMRNKVTGLRGAGRIGDAKAAADRMLTEFGASTDKAIAEQAGAVRRIRAAL